MKELFLKKFKSVRDGKNNDFIAPCKSFGVDLILRKINKNWKIGIAVEVTSDLTESGVKNRKETFPKSILSKITDAQRNYNLDLLVFLFCINTTNKGYNETLNITKGRLEQIENERFMYISPEYLIGFFEELFNELEI